MWIATRIFYLKMHLTSCHQTSRKESRVELDKRRGVLFEFRLWGELFA
jgi:hypothetical protein